MKSETCSMNNAIKIFHSVGQSFPIQNTHFIYTKQSHYIKNSTYRKIGLITYYSIYRYPVKDFQQMATC